MGREGSAITFEESKQVGIEVYDMESRASTMIATENFEMVTSMRS